MNNKHLSIFLLLLVVFVGLFFYLVDRYTALEKRINEIDTETEKVKERTPSVSNNVTTDNLTKNWKTYIYGGPEVLDFKKYKLKYPNSWEIKIEQDYNEPNFSVVTLIRSNGDKLEIMQASGGYERCLFSDDKDYESFNGPSLRFSKYTTINSKLNLRIGIGGGTYGSDTQYICQKSGGEYYTGTEIGSVKSKSSSAESLKEIELILENFEILD